MAKYKYILLLGIAGLSACASTTEKPKVTTIYSESYKSSCASLGYCEIFEHENGYFTGTANVEPSNGGIYVYKEDIAPKLKKTNPIVLGKVPRHQWEFFAPDEERALLELQDEKIAKRERDRLLKERKAYIAKAAKLDWPKVIEQNGQICVPELSEVNSADWKSHLSCYDKKGIE